jgi:putative hemolysin
MVPIQKIKLENPRRNVKVDGGSGSILLEMSLILLLILLNAFFAASELAIISSNRTRLGIMADEGNKKAKLLLQLISEPSKFLATIQVGITLAGFLASASAAVSISGVFADVLKSLGIPFITAASRQISLVTVTIILAFVTLVVGELLPKRLALQNPEGIAMFAVTPIMFISKVMRPFVAILTASTNFFARLLGSNMDNIQEKVTEEEIRMMIHVGEENGVINETEKEMIDGIFEFDNTLAKEVMTPRNHVFILGINTPIDEVLDAVADEQYSRIPVYEDDPDNIIGILYMKDLFTQMRKIEIEDMSIRDILRPAYFVPESKNIDTLFRELQNSKNHMAILIDEYGGFSGLLTIEDLVEEIVGKIADEHDEDIRDIEKLDNNTYLVYGMVTIDELNEELDLDLVSKNYDTLGGFVLDILGNIPGEDEKPSVEYENIEFKVEKVKEKRIEYVKIHIK